MLGRPIHLACNVCTEQPHIHPPTHRTVPYRYGPDAFDALLGSSSNMTIMMCGELAYAAGLLYIGLKVTGVCVCV